MESSHTNETNNTAVMTTTYVNVSSGDWAWVLTTLEALEQAHARDSARLETLEREVSNSVKRRDSVEIGTAGKGGQVKIYFDSVGDSKQNDAAVAEALRILRSAGGVPANGGV